MVADEVEDVSFTVKDDNWIGVPFLTGFLQAILRLLRCLGVTLLRSTYDYSKVFTPAGLQVLRIWALL